MDEHEPRANETYEDFLSLLARHFGVKDTKEILADLLDQMECGNIAGDSTFASRKRGDCGCIIGTIADRLNTNYSILRHEMGLSEAPYYSDFAPWEAELWNHVSPGHTPEDSDTLAGFYEETKTFLASLEALPTE